MKAMAIKFIEVKFDGLPRISVMKGDAVSLLIRWRYDHKGRGRNWSLEGCNIRQQFRLIDEAKSQAHRLLANPSHRVTPVAR